MNEEGTFVYNPNSFEVSGYAESANGPVYAEKVPYGLEVTKVIKQEKFV